MCNSGFVLCDCLLARPLLTFGPDFSFLPFQTRPVSASKVGSSKSFNDRKESKTSLNTLSLLLQVSAATNKRKTPSDKRVVVGYGVTDAQARDREREGGSFLSFTTEAAF